MAEPRSKKLKRLVAVQRRIEQLAELELANTHREQALVAESIGQLVEAMGTMSQTHRLFSQVYARRIAALTLTGQRLKGLAGVQEKRVAGERAKADRLAERLADETTSEERAAEDETLLDLIDQIAGREAAQASRKLRRP